MTSTTIIHVDIAFGELTASAVKGLDGVCFPPVGTPVIVTASIMDEDNKTHRKMIKTKVESVFWVLDDEQHNAEISLQPIKAENEIELHAICRNLDCEDWRVQFAPGFTKTLLSGNTLVRK